MKHDVSSGQIGLASEPPQYAMHVPTPVPGSTSQHRLEIAQSSSPDCGEPAMVHGSPGCAGSGASSRQIVAFH